MHTPKFNRFATAVIGFVMGISIGTFGHGLVTMISKTTTRGLGAEAMRVTSPDGKLDAVLVDDNSGGVLGGIFWYLYVVPRGKPVPNDTAKRLFFADELTKGAIVWNKAHLIEIHYDKASIMHFRNISTTYENGLEDVELRLAPCSEHSLVTPEGGWRSDN